MPPGPFAAGVPNANPTITANPAAKIPHKRKAPEGSPLGRAALKASLFTEAEPQWPWQYWPGWACGWAGPLGRL